MKKIIVPVDFSEYSEYALEVAAALAKKNKAEIVVLHMLEIAESLINSAGSLNYEEVLFFSKRAKNKFEHFLDKTYLKDIKVSDVVQYHKVFSEVNDTAINQGADLIVMGSHGASGMKEVFLGSNTEKVIRHSDVPVLVIKERIKDFNLKEVVFALDFKEESISSYQKAIQFFKQVDAKVTFLYINLPHDAFRSSDEIEERIRLFFQKADPEFTNYKDVVVRNDYTIEKGVLTFAAKMNTDLIAIPTHGRTGLAHFFMGSISEGLANHSQLPVITFKM